MASIAPQPPQHWSPASPRALRRLRAAPRRRRSCRVRRRGRSGARRGPGGCPGSPIRNLGIFGEFVYPIVSLKKHIFFWGFVSWRVHFMGILFHVILATTWMGKHGIYEINVWSSLLFVNKMIDIVYIRYESGFNLIVIVYGLSSKKIIYWVRRFSARHVWLPEGNGDFMDFDQYYNAYVYYIYIYIYISILYIERERSKEIQRWYYKIIKVNRSGMIS